MSLPSECPVCLCRHSSAPKVSKSGGILYINCEVCGQYSLPEELWSDALDPQTGAGHTLSDLCRARLSHRLATGAPVDRAGRSMVTSEYLDGFLRDKCPGPTPSQQATNILAYVGDLVSASGNPIDHFPKNFYAIVGAPNPQFAHQLVIDLRDKGLLSGMELTEMDGAELRFASLTLDGWERYESEKRGLVSGKYGFIAMKFNDAQLDPFVRDVVKPAVKQGIGYDLVDMRDVSRAGLIDNIMRAQIRDAAFVIVDLTHDNSGAYWEAGYAEGLRNPVIYVCEKTKFDEAKTHFDTNHCTTVLWSQDAADHFRKELLATLRRSLNLFPDSSQIDSR